MSKKYFTFCPHCQEFRQCNILRKYVSNIEIPEALIYSCDTHLILQCRGCEKIFYELETWNSEDTIEEIDELGEPRLVPKKYKKTYPPSQIFRKNPFQSLTDPTFKKELGDLLQELYSAYNINALILTAIGIRTVIEKTATIVGIDPSKYFHFEKKIEQLEQKGFIGKNDRQALTTLVESGNAAAHRAWAPTKRELSTLLDFLEGFLHNLFITRKELFFIQERIPPRKKHEAQSVKK